MKIFRSSNVHYHGIIHAIIFTFWVYLLQKAGTLFFQSQYEKGLLQFEWFYHLIVYSSYLFFAIWQYTISSKENTILANFHSGVVISFIHPFIYTFFYNFVELNELSILGVSAHYIVGLMILSLPIAILIYFIKKQKNEEKKRREEQLLDNNFGSL